MNTVTNRQMFYFLFLTVTTAVIVISNTMARAAGRGGWIPLLITSFIFAIEVIFICKLNSMYQNKMIFDYSQEIVGNVISKIIIIYLIIYFIFSFIYYSASFSGFVKVEFLYETPHLALLTVTIAGIGFIVCKGITNMARAIEIIAPIYMLFAFVLYGVLLVQGMKYNLLPLFSIDMVPNFISAIKDCIVPFLGIEVLLIIPFTNHNKKTSKLSFLTIILVGLYYILIFEGTVGILGINESMVHKYAGFEGLKLITIPVIERADIVFETIGYAAVFFRNAIYYLCAVELLCKLLPKVKRWLICLLVGIFSLILCEAFVSLSGLEKIFTIILSIAGIIAAFIIPIILLITAKVKKNKEKENGEKNAKNS